MADMPRVRIDQIDVTDEGGVDVTYTTAAEDAKQVLAYTGAEAKPILDILFWMPVFGNFGSGSPVRRITHMAENHYTILTMRGSLLKVDAAVFADLQKVLACCEKLVERE